MLAGEVLNNDFYGIVLEGIKWPPTFVSVLRNFIYNWGGDIFDENGRPTFDTPVNIAAVQFWADLWQYGTSRTGGIFAYRHSECDGNRPRGPDACVE